MASNLPYSDPVTGSSPYFQDNNFVKGSQFRNNNAAIWANFSAFELQNFGIPGFTTQATAAGTTTLASTSRFIQQFTGSTTQTVTLPTIATAPAVITGQSFLIVNDSTGTVTVKSSGANTVATLYGGNRAFITCVVASGTGASSWAAEILSNTGSTATATASVIPIADANALLDIWVTSQYNAGITNCKATLSSTTITLDAATGTIGANNPIKVALPSGTSGVLTWQTLTAALSMTLPSGTFTRSTSLMGFTNTDGSSTLTLSGNAVNVILYAYVIYDTNTAYMAISRSPFHTQTPTNYCHTPSATTLTQVGTDGWDTMIISKAGVLTNASSPAVCLGPMWYGTISGSTGRFSAMALTTGEFPKFNNRLNPYKYDGTNVFRHEFRVDTSTTYGSTDTKIPIFTNNTINKGYALQYLTTGGASSSGNIGGAEFVATEPGWYEFIFHTVSGSGAGGICGWSLNSAQRTTSIVSITLANRLSISGSATNTGLAPCLVFLNAGDIVRPHTDGGAIAPGGWVPFATGAKISW